jgi:c(7)-type cytochrome triheme protein
MASMAAGENCGTCHNGTKAFGAMDSTQCMTCHRPPGAPAAAPTPAIPPPAGAETRRADLKRAEEKKPEAKAPAKATQQPAAKAPAQVGGGDITYTGAAGSPAPVVFSHARHAERTPNCADCHPKPFSMPRGTAKFPMASMAAGENCGTCHNGTKAFGAMDAARCTTCHRAN